MPVTVLDTKSRSDHKAADVIGVYASESGLDPIAVEHVALLAQARSILYNQPVGVHHVSPTYGPSQMEEVNAHVVGSIPGLTDDERTALLIEAQSLDTLRSKVRYHVRPHYEEEIRANHSRVVRCSCVGMILHVIGVVLKRFPPPLEPLSNDYLEVDLATLREVFSAQTLGTPARRKRAGLTEDDGPWKVGLPGHLIHALKGGPSCWPYEPKQGDHCYS